MSDDEIFEACTEGDVDTVVNWIKSGGDITMTDENEYTLLHLAVFSNQYALVEVLLEAGIDIEAGGEEEGGYFPGTVFYYACSYGHLEIVKLLKEKNAQLNSVSPMGVTGLMNAAQEGHKEVVQFLLKHQADSTIKDADRATVFHYLMYPPQITDPAGLETVKKEIALELLSAGVDINAQARTKATALDVAMGLYSKDFCQFLIDKGAKSGF